MRTVWLVGCVAFLVGMAVVASHTVQARAVGPMSHRVSEPPFDVKLYESYVRSHHRRAIPFRDTAGRVTSFAQAWMRHRRQCGGAISPLDTNPTTLSMLQEWQGCTAIRRLGERTIRFHPESWIP